ncbi:hypothetical protein WJX82_002975 [Trebouxia sp. C0006]
MGLASRFKTGASAQPAGSPQQQTQYQPSGPTQPQTPAQYPAIQQSWQAQPQQYQSPQQGYQQPQYGVQQPGYQQPGYPQPGYQQPMYQQQNYQPPSQQWQQPQSAQAPQAYQPRPQPQQQVGSSGGLNDQGIQTVLHNQLNNIIRVNRLEAFYPPQRLQQVKDHVATVDFRALAIKWRMPVELALDLVALALYDIVIYADDSTSMKYAESGARIDDMKVILERVTEVATLFDHDGISIRFMNSNLQGDNICDSISAANLLARCQFSGMTPLGTQMHARILKPMVEAAIANRTLQKPVLVITITDGEPTSEPESKIVKVIKNMKAFASKSQYGSGAVAFEFAQVGKDTDAQAFLGRLDNDKDVGGMVDATSYFELEAEEYKQRGIVLTPELWLVKLMVGAIDPTYDEQDA